MKRWIPIPMLLTCMLFSCNRSNVAPSQATGSIDKRKNFYGARLYSGEASYLATGGRVYTTVKDLRVEIIKVDDSTILLKSDSAAYLPYANRLSADSNDIYFYETGQGTANYNAVIYYYQGDSIKLVKGEGSSQYGRVNSYYLHSQ